MTHLGLAKASIRLPQYNATALGTGDLVLVLVVLLVYEAFQVGHLLIGHLRWQSSRFGNASTE